MKVDIEKVISDKNPKLGRALPKPIIAYFKRIIHQDEINFILENYSHLSSIEFIQATLSYMGVDYSSTGIDKLDPKKRYLFAANHPFGGMDGMMFCDELHKYFGSGQIITNDILMNVTPLTPLFIPVNKHGRQNSNYSKRLREALLSNTQIATFPAGICSRRKKGVIKDLDWKPSFIKNAISSNRDIVPVYFEGRLSNFFYRLSNIRKALGIKANIEMTYLVDEMFAQKGKHFNITFGTPITVQELQNGQSAMAWSHEIKDIVYSLNG